MKLLSVIFLKHEVGKAPFVLSAHFELSTFGFFQRGGVQEICTFASREVVHRSEEGAALQSVKYQEYLCHTRIAPNGLAVVTLCDQDYPRYVAFSLLKEALELFTQRYKDSAWKDTTTDLTLALPGMDAILKRYQDPAEADKLMKIKKDLDETKEIVIKSMDQLLARGERLEDLIEISNDLSFQSKAFAKRTEDLNSCCVIL